ncbi:hypothetical protein CBD41_00370 [bacterium TMED181]|nr:hypothetical protein [Planctomycetota bacterium]OUW47771.1 MAG: hypothetical protein CBD41_00370 [bacterium TMED181]
MGSISSFDPECLIRCIQEHVLPIGVEVLLPQHTSQSMLSSVADLNSPQGVSSLGRLLFFRGYLGH